MFSNRRQGQRGVCGCAGSFVQSQNMVNTLIRDNVTSYRWHLFGPPGAECKTLLVLHLTGKVSGKTKGNVKQPCELFGPDKTQVFFRQYAVFELLWKLTSLPVWSNLANWSDLKQVSWFAWNCGFTNSFLEDRYGEVRRSSCSLCNKGFFLFTSSMKYLH